MTIGELERDEAEWVVLFRALDRDEREAVYQIVRSIVGGVRPNTVHLPASVVAAFRGAGLA